MPAPLIVEPGRLGVGRLRATRMPIAFPTPLVIVTHGNSVMRGEGATSGHQPSDRIASLRGMTVGVNVFNEAVNGQDIDYFISNFSGQVHPRKHATADVSWVIIGETLIYVNDTLGAAGTGQSLSSPSAAAVANYNKHVTYAQAAKALGWRVAVLCMPDCVEPASYAGAPTGATDNTTYRNVRDQSYDLMRADSTNFDRVIDARVRSEFSDPWSLTYYGNAGDGERIHLVDAGYDLLGTVCSQGLP